MEGAIQILGLISMVIHVMCCGGCGPCDFSLVTGPYGVSDNAITASSTHPDCPLQFARFSSSRAWCPSHRGDGHYLQVEFRNVSSLQAIQTRGREDHPQWVSLYTVNISMDGLTWNSILTSTGDVKVFHGNSDSDTIVSNELKGNVVAKYIRVISVSGNTYRSMRLEVQGCPFREISNTCHRWEARLGSTRRRLHSSRGHGRIKSRNMWPEVFQTIGM
ncbi:inactive carboxypeptidase-like protein X2 [Pecten maximus]|uniref:inactive carboxypeptidase-like protein X2 n=1 Tax=Pecten maximus TaxID=6579 RepID=UPI0014583AA0|nr:inactive carboxypeptidase-like protein X2 [Pecten maximus]